MKEPQVIKERVKVIYTEEELFVRLKVFIGCCLALTLMGIVFVVLYSIIFVTQPLGAISPVDTKFFELIIPIATFLTGTLSGIMLANGNKDAEMKALEAATRPPAPPSPAPAPPTPSGPRPGFGGFSSGAAFTAGAAMPKIEPNFDIPVSPSSASPFDTTFKPADTVFSGGDPITKNGKLAPPQEQHPLI